MNRWAPMLRFREQSSKVPNLPVDVLDLWWIMSMRTEGVNRNLSRRPPGKLVTLMEKWHTSVKEYRNYPAALVGSIALSTLFLVLSGLNFWFAAMTFESGVEIGTVFFIVPTILTLGSLPVSIGGWGLQELSAAVVFDSAGVEASLGPSAALLIRGKDVVLALIGCMLYLLPSKPRPRNGTNLSSRFPGPLRSTISRGARLWRRALAMYA
jgi:uncharacterized membrane protein YbhN (UPF0104 family)